MNQKNRDQNGAEASREAAVRFDDVSFGYGHNHRILDEASFTLRRGMKMALMGQNGAGKSTIFKLITGALTPDDGAIQKPAGLTIAMAHQSVLPDERELTVRAFFEKRFPKKVYDIDPKIDAALDAVNLAAPKDRLVKSFSGGQQARLLLASALIQDPDLLLLDEPTNNLDAAGIEHLTAFLKDYAKTCMVISHDAEFLNAFTHGVLYLLMVGMPILGVLALAWGGKPIQPFGLTLTLPLLQDKSLASLSKEVHESGATLVYIFVGLHAAAALWHEFMLKDRLLRRMI